MKSLLLILFCIAAASGSAADTLRVTDLTAKPQVTKTLTGRDAAKILKAFESLPWDHTAGKRCHFPVFRIERPAGESPALDATICFACNNVSFSKPAQKGLQGFDASTEIAKQFHTTLTSLFPTQ